MKSVHAYDGTCWAAAGAAGTHKGAACVQCSGSSVLSRVHVCCAAAAVWGTMVHMCVCQHHHSIEIVSTECAGISLCQTATCVSYPLSQQCPLLK